MNPTQLRRIAQKYGTLGVLFVGALLLLQSLWQRKSLLFASLGLTALAVGLYLPLRFAVMCRVPVSTHFEPQFADEYPGNVAEEPTAYRIVDLGALPGGQISEATGISDKGHVVGVSELRGEAFHGFFWDGKMRDIGTLGGEISVALGVNNSGQVVGIGDDRQGMVRGFVWQNGKMRDIGHLGGGLTIATGMNNRGGVVGISATRDYEGHAFYWQDGKMRDIGTPKGYDLSFAQGINDKGVIVGLAVSSESGNARFERFEYQQTLFQIRIGRYDNDGGLKLSLLRSFGLFAEANSLPRGFAWKDGRFVELKGRRGATAALAVNNKGQVVGADYSERDDSIRAMLWESEQGKELPLPSGFSDSFAVDISEDGTVVGGAFSEENVTACAWKNGKAQDLNKLLPSGSGWTLYFAESINSKGQIVGIGDHNGQLRAFLLAPK